MSRWKVRWTLLFAATAPWFAAAAPTPDEIHERRWVAGVSARRIDNHVREAAAKQIGPATTTLARVADALRTAIARTHAARG